MNLGLFLDPFVFSCCPIDGTISICRDQKSCLAIAGRERILNANSLSLWTFVVLLSLFRCHGFRRWCLCAHTPPQCSGHTRHRHQPWDNCFLPCLNISSIDVFRNVLWPRLGLYGNGGAIKGWHALQAVSKWNCRKWFPSLSETSDKTLTRGPERLVK